MTTAKKPAHINIDVRDILNIFQIKNPEVSTIITNQTEIKNIYGNMLAMMQKFEASSTPILENAGAMRKITMATTSSDGGGFLMSSIVETISDQAEIEIWLFVIIGEVVDSGQDIEAPAQRYKLKPHFLLSGVSETNNNFVVHDCGARLETNDSPAKWMKANNLDDYYSIMLYGDAAFRTMMTDEKMDIGKFEFHLDPDCIQMAKHGYDEIKYRTATDLALYIIECADDDPYPLKPNTVMAPPPPILQ